MPRYLNFEIFRLGARSIFNTVILLERKAVAGK